MRPKLADWVLASGRTCGGLLNGITGVAGVRVGHTTIEDDEINTGMMAIAPDTLSAARTTLAAGLADGNGYGKLVGATQITELGAIETPVLLTSTLSAFRVADSLVTEVLAQPWHATTTTLNRIARRALYGMRGVGADFATDSGDFAIAFAPGEGTPPNDDDPSLLFHTTKLAVEEALINSVLHASTAHGPEGRRRARGTARSVTGAPHARGRG